MLNASRKTEELGNRELYSIAGGVLGGGSSINGFVYARAQQFDLDDWNVKGWSADGMIPFYKKFETYHGLGSKETHGVDGPLEVSRGYYRGKPLEDGFVASMRSLGYPEVDDLQDFGTIDAYLHPKLRDKLHPNLHVLLETQVVRVLFDGPEKCASRIECIANPVHKLDSSERKSYEISATSLVVLSSGVLGSPAILDRSGIGDPEVMKRAGVSCLHPLPGVGSNFLDHQFMTTYYKSNLPLSESLDGVFDNLDQIPKLVAQNDRVLSWHGFDASSKIRPSDREVDSLGPQFKELWKQDFWAKHKRPLASIFIYSGLLHIKGPELADPVDFGPGAASSAPTWASMVPGVSKVADLSVAPVVGSANTHRTTLMVGEKATAIFIEKLGLGTK
ncbi:GMC oxidoreductase-domain-containing protein [Xylariomycetidae sp. FL2044]|nr:GMC oxidoreductase-domain-containing protein [Xylariomycetidae sp. FL2044]